MKTGSFWLNKHKMLCPDRNKNDNTELELKKKNNTITLRGMIILNFHVTAYHEPPPMHI